MDIQQDMDKDVSALTKGKTGTSCCLGVFVGLDSICAMMMKLKKKLGNLDAGK